MTTTLIANRYRIDRKLGQGAFGQVFLAHDASLGDRTVALKLLHPVYAIDPSAVQRFRREANLLAQLDHPAIVPIYDAGLAGDQLFLVMRYLPGGSLAQLLAEQGALPPTRVLALLRDLADGLDHAHAAGVIHRDLKPANLLLDARGHVVITDFGLARAVLGGDSYSVKPDSLAVIGTAAYMAPEIAVGAEPTPASDRYSLGCVLYELLSGSPPFSGANTNAILYQHEHKPPPPLTLDDPQGRALAAQMQRLLSKDPSQRPADLTSVVAAVDHSLAGSQPAAPTKARIAVVPNLPPYVLLGDKAVRSLEELVAVAAKQPELVFHHLGTAKLTLWLESAGEDDLAKLCASMTSIPHLGRTAALKQFLDATGIAHDYTGQPASIFDWVTIPAGPFLMGSNPADDPNAQTNEQPQHRVYVDAFRISRTPVTVAQFTAFVDATGYVTAQEREKGDSEANWRQPNGVGSNISKKANHPVTWVTWDDAVAFCRWADVRLPTEAEWEKAARGIDGRLYPWGNTPPDNKRCNFNNAVKDTTPVDAYPTGASPFGVLDMAGNVWEWCGDWYEEKAYQQKDRKNPTGPASGTYRVLRGGSWWNDYTNVRCAYRDWDDPINRDGGGGFRVVSPGC